MKGLRERLWRWAFGHWWDLDDHLKPSLKGWFWYNLSDIIAGRPRKVAPTEKSKEEL